MMQSQPGDPLLITLTDQIEENLFADDSEEEYTEPE